MPTILKACGLRVMIYFNNHRPHHVHVVTGDEEAVFYLGDETTGPSIKENLGMSPKHLRAALSIVEEEQTKLLRAWREIWLRSGSQ